MGSESGQRQRCFRWCGEQGMALLRRCGPRGMGYDSCRVGPLAQSAEHLTFNQVVAGSIPARPTNYFSDLLSFKAGVAGRRAVVRLANLRTRSPAGDGSGLSLDPNRVDRLPADHAVLRVPSSSSFAPRPLRDPHPETPAASMRPGRGRCGGVYIRIGMSVTWSPLPFPGHPRAASRGTARRCSTRGSRSPPRCTSRSSRGRSRKGTSTPTGRAFRPVVSSRRRRWHPPPRWARAP